MNNEAETVAELIGRLDGSGSERELAAVRELRAHEGSRLPELLLQKYQRERKAGARSSCIYHAIRYARESESAITLGIQALGDRSKIVRYRACILLAYSLRKDVVPELRRVLLVMPESSRDDVLAAIDAIESGNHNFFVDRDHSGSVTLNVR